MEFSKYEASGNDFIMIDGTGASITMGPEMIEKLCRRRSGIGADGLIILSDSRDSDFMMRIYNADGSEAEMCGNGIRTLFLFAMDRGYVEKRKIAVETGAGEKIVSFLGDSSGEKVFSVNMGKPSYRRAEIPMEGPPGEEAVDVEISLDEDVIVCTCVSMGNPHCVVFVKDLEGCPVSRLGPRIELHELFPERTNVEFVQVESPHVLSARVWERGVGETMACGTGSCAIAAASVLKGFCDGDVTVSLPGGDLSICFEGEEMVLSGPARHVFDGVLGE